MYFLYEEKFAKNEVNTRPAILPNTCVCAFSMFFFCCCFFVCFSSAMSTRKVRALARQKVFS